MLCQFPDIEPAFVDHRSADVTHRDDAQPCGREQECEGSAHLAEALDHGSLSRELDAEHLEGAAHAHDDAGRSRARVHARATDRQWLSGDCPGHEPTGRHRERVHQPGHHSTVGVDVGRRDVAVRAEEGRDLVRVAAGQPLELAQAQA